MRKILIFMAVLVLALALAAAVSAKGHRSGQELFDTICKGCHDTGMMDAPLIRSAEFKERLAKKGFDKLFEDAKSGIGDMPAKGSCGDCSDDELKTAIRFLLGMK